MCIVHSDVCSHKGIWSRLTGLNFLNEIVVNFGFDNLPVYSVSKKHVIVHLNSVLAEQHVIIVALVELSCEQVLPIELLDWFLAKVLSIKV